MDSCGLVARCPHSSSLSEHSLVLCGSPLSLVPVFFVPFFLRPSMSYFSNTGPRECLRDKDHGLGGGGRAHEYSSGSQEACSPLPRHAPILKSTFLIRHRQPPWEPHASLYSPFSHEEKQSQRNSCWLWGFALRSAHPTKSLWEYNFSSVAVFTEQEGKCAV